MKAFRIILLFGWMMAVATLACNKPDKQKLFTKTTAQQTGIEFENKVEENEQLNIMTYEYLYNGAGVAVGDVNNDGRTDIFFTGNMVANKLFINKGNFKFEDITSQAGVGGRQRWKTGATMADVNGDGLLDIYVCYSGPGTNDERRNELYINNGGANGMVTFSEKAVEYGLDAPGSFSTQCVFFDMDKDGDLDAFLVNHADMFYNAFFNTSKLRRTRHSQFGNRLYRNDGGKFVDISETAGIDGSGLNFGLSVSVSDLNNDNWPDLYVTNDYHEQDFLYLNKKNGTFYEVLQQSMGHISAFSMGSSVDDYNNDLQPDVITLDMLPEDNKRQKLLKGPDGYDTYKLLVDNGFHHQNMRNMLQLNMGINADGIPQFSEIGQLAGISNTDWSWAPLTADFDNDGWKDMYITNGYLRDFTNLDFIKFTYAEAQAETQKTGQKINTWELVKGLPSTKISNYLFSNNHHLGFENRTAEWGVDFPSISTGATYADLDNDGDLDLIVNNSNQPVDIYKNNTESFFKNHYIKIKLKGTGNNKHAIGAKVMLSTDSTQQMREVCNTKGFQSSVEPVLHFGLGRPSVIKTLQVIWPDGNISSLQNIKADTLLTIDYTTAVAPLANATSKQSTLFADYTLLSGIKYQHKENTNFVDFKSQFLLPQEISKQGPFLTKGDVNGDGLEDVFISGSFETPGQLYLQTNAMNFIATSSQPWAGDKAAKDGAVLLFDADADKDLDLFISKSGTEFQPNDQRYQASLYINNGKGNFVKTSTALPAILASSISVASADYDKDGDYDLFVGGRTIPGSYPISPFSYLLKNVTQNGVAKFVYASEQPERLLRTPGMVTTAVWADINSDTWPDLIVAGEFMPITVFENKRGSLIHETAKYGLQETNGMWCKILAEDMDADGDLDIVAGNIGLNTQFKASPSEPLSLCYDDFDQNGSIDPILSYFIQGKNYPFASLDELAEQIPVIRKKFLRYEAYSNATFEQLFTTDQMQKAKIVKATELRTVYLENKNGKYIVHRLPIEAQFSATMGIIAGDWNKDGKKDLLLSGNYFPWRVQLGKMDAGKGWLAMGEGNGKFTILYPQQTGISFSGDVRDMIMIHTKQQPIFVATRNNSSVIVIKQNPATGANLRRVK